MKVIITRFSALNFPIRVSERYSKAIWLLSTEWTIKMIKIIFLGGESCQCSVKWMHLTMAPCKPDLQIVGTLLCAPLVLGSCPRATEPSFISSSLSNQCTTNPVQKNLAKVRLFFLGFFVLFFFNTLCSRQNVLFHCCFKLATPISLNQCSRF